MRLTCPHCSLVQSILTSFGLPIVWLLFLLIQRRNIGVQLKSIQFWIPDRELVHSLIFRNNCNFKWKWFESKHHRLFSLGNKNENIKGSELLTMASVNDGVGRTLLKIQQRHCSVIPVLLRLIEAMETIYACTDHIEPKYLEIKCWNFFVLLVFSADRIFKHKKVRDILYVKFCWFHFYSFIQLQINMIGANKWQ